MAPGWWVVDGQRVVAGPFEDRGEADFCDLPPEYVDDDEAISRLQSAYGSPRADGTFDERPSPEDRAWEAHLAEQLERIPGSLGKRWLAGDRSLEVAGAVAVATALVEVGLPLHDCEGHSPLGGACVAPAQDSISVTWSQHRRAIFRASELDGRFHAVQDVMTKAISDVLAACLGVTMHGDAYEAGKAHPALLDRETAEERAWQAHLAEQLERIPGSLGHRWLAGDRSPQAVLAAEIASAVFEAGLPLYDSDRQSSLGGVYVGRAWQADGYTVVWAQHDRQAHLHVRGYQVFDDVQNVMNDTLRDLLRVLGFRVEPDGKESGFLVTGHARG
ncbi:hypothetical protein ACFYYP_32635 [Microbispora rosea]|uniref:hypothetical protein n=1 Tax=Microbispora rosea TaxID=58117 RepID=UPI003690CF71